MSNPILMQDSWNVIKSFLELQERLICCDVCKSVKRYITTNPRWNDNLHYIEINKYSWDTLLCNISRIAAIENPIISVKRYYYGFYKPKKYDKGKFLQMIKLDNQMSDIEDHLREYLENNEIKYRLQIIENSVPDTMPRTTNTDTENVVSCIVKYIKCRFRFSEHFDGMTSVTEIILDGINDISWCMFRNHPQWVVNLDGLMGSARPFELSCTNGRSSMLDKKQTTNITSITLIGYYSDDEHWAWTYNKKIVYPIIIDAIEKSFGNLQTINLKFNDVKYDGNYVLMHDEPKNVTVNGWKISNIPKSEWNNVRFNTGLNISPGFSWQYHCDEWGTSAS
jgi:hypothetical protein